MGREFNRNMFIMLLSIMVGVIIITFFIADLQARSDVTETLSTKHSAEIKTIEEKNINFTTRFITSLGQLDMSREDRATGNYHFQLGSNWYTSAITETNETEMFEYKTIGMDNCSKAEESFLLAAANFEVANIKFEQTKNYSHEIYYDLLDLYIDLTESGIRLTSLQANASNYLYLLIENITMNDFGQITFLENITELFGLFNTTMGLIAIETGIYGEIEEQVEREYNIEGFSEFRED